VVTEGSCRQQPEYLIECDSWFCRGLFLFEFANKLVSAPVPVFQKNEKQRRWVFFSISYEDPKFHCTQARWLQRKRKKNNEFGCGLRHSGDASGVTSPSVLPCFAYYSLFACVLGRSGAANYRVLSSKRCMSLLVVLRYPAGNSLQKMRFP
jgi:hypothetical protein